MLFHDMQLHNARVREMILPTIPRANVKKLKYGAAYVGTYRSGIYYYNSLMKHIKF
jgi:hypothetical protein